jgi:uncharacterized membrane protein YcjF (UPF0283 family)
MKLRISGALFATSLISWGYLLWNHFPQESWVIFTAVYGLMVVIFIEVSDMYY